MEKRKLEGMEEGKLINKLLFRNSLKSLPLLAGALPQLQSFSIDSNPLEDPFSVWAERVKRKDGVSVTSSLSFFKCLGEVPPSWLVIYTAACRSDGAVIREAVEKVGVFLALIGPGIRTTISCYMQTYNYLST